MGEGQVKSRAMGNNNVILEFNGLPGSGKTAISKELMELESSSKEEYVLYEDVLKDEFPKSKLLEIGWLLFLFINPSNLLFLYYSLSLFKNVEQITSERLRRMYRLMRMYFIYKRIFKKIKPRVIIVDQGILQQILSILYLDSLKNEVVIKKLFLYIKKTIPSYCLVNTNVPVHQVVGRIRNRGKLDSRIDLLSADQILPALELQRENLEKIRSLLSIEKVQSLTIDTTLPPKQNALHIQGWLDYHWRDSSRHLLIVE